MAGEPADSNPTLALNTTLENDFVSPLTSLQGAIELLRDFPGMSQEERAPFFSMALEDCARLARGIDRLAETVYAAAEQSEAVHEEPTAEDQAITHERVGFHEDLGVVEVDFSDFRFTSSTEVHAFYDILDQMIVATGYKWYVVVNYQGFSIWPEAWVAHAHRVKQINEMYALGNFRYTSPEDAATAQDDATFGSRKEVLAHVAALRGGS